MKMIYFISGAGRSGSTLLDIVLGSSEDHFSTGELINLVKNGIHGNEYCSCGTKVILCSFWSEVLQDWGKTRELSLKEFQEIQWKYLRNKSTLRSVWNFWFPSKDYRLLLQDTNSLIDSVFKKSGKNILIDSSKIPQYLLLLLKTGRPIKIIHLTRPVSKVIKSNRKTLLKDASKGVEKTRLPQSYLYAFANWTVTNFLVYLFSFMRNRIRVKYEDFIEDPATVMLSIYRPTKENLELFRNRGPFKADHLVAGGRIRMNKSITIIK